MTRPVEYENLLNNGTFKAAVANPTSISQFMSTAQDMETAATTVTAPGPRFILAYDGMFNVVMAVLEFYGVRPGDGNGHRVSAIGRVAADLQLGPAQHSALGRLHESRNRVTYKTPIPPVTNADAKAMLSILQAMLPAAKALIGSSSSASDAGTPP